MTTPKTTSNKKHKITKKHIDRLAKSVNVLSQQMKLLKPKERVINLELVYAVQALQALSEHLQTDIQVKYKPRIGFQ